MPSILSFFKIDKQNKWLSFIKQCFYGYDLDWILFLALVLRVAKLKNAFYGHTSELFRDLGVVYDMFEQHQLVLLGPPASLGGFSFGAIYYYLLAPFVYLFSFQHLGAIALSTAFSLLSIAMLFTLLRLWFKPIAIARWGAFLAAVTFFDVQNAYYISNPNLLPFFVLLIFYGLTLFLRGNEHWYVGLLTGVALGIATQLHATALLILPLTVLAVLIMRRKIPPLKYLFVTIAGGISVYLPYFIYEISHKFENFRRIFQLSSQNFDWFIKPESLVSVLSFAVSSFFFKNIWFDLMDFNPVLLYILFGLLSIFILALFFWKKSQTQALFAKDEITREAKIILSCWSFVGLLTFLFYSNSIPPFYFLILWPLPLIVLAWFFYSLRKGSAWLFGFILMLFLSAQAINLFYFYQIVERKQFDYPQYADLFRDFKAEAGLSSFNVINDLKDGNYFYYYLKLSGLNHILTRVDADYLFVVYNDITSPRSVPNPQKYKEISVNTRYNLTIYKYEAVRIGKP